MGLTGRGFFVHRIVAPGLSQANEHPRYFPESMFFRSPLRSAEQTLDPCYIQAGRTFQNRANGIIKGHDLGGCRAKPGSFGDVQRDALRSPAEMINKRVLPGPAGREPIRRSSTFQGLLVNLEFVMSE